MYLFFILFILFIIFIPIPIAFKVTYINNDIKIYIYKKLVFSLENFKNKKKKISKKNNIKSSHIKDKKTKSKLNIKKLINAVYTNKFKPTLKINFFMEYSLDDSFYTALLYGVLYNLLGVTCSLLSTIFYLKTVNSKISPLFINTNKFFIDLKGIIYINFAKIIYIFFKYLLN